MMTRAILLLLAVALTGCVNQTVKSTSVPPLAQPPQPIPDAQVLDVDQKRYSGQSGDVFDCRRYR